MSNGERDLESEREEFLAQLDLHVPTELKARIESVLSLTAPPPQVSITLSYSGAADAHEK